MPATDQRRMKLMSDQIRLLTQKSHEPCAFFHLSPLLFWCYVPINCFESVQTIWSIGWSTQTYQWGSLSYLKLCVWVLGLQMGLSPGVSYPSQFLLSLQGFLQSRSVWNSMATEMCLILASGVCRKRYPQTPCHKLLGQCPLDSEYHG